MRSRRMVALPGEHPCGWKGQAWPMGGSEGPCATPARPTGPVVDSHSSSWALHPKGRAAVALLPRVSAGTAHSLLQLKDKVSGCQALPEHHTRHLHKHPFGRGRAAHAAGRSQLAASPFGGSVPQTGFLEGA